MSGSSVLSATILWAAAILLATRVAVWFGWWLVSDDVLVANVPAMFIGLAADGTILLATVRIVWRAAHQGANVAASLLLKLACVIAIVSSLSNGLDQLARSQLRMPTLRSAPVLLPVTDGAAFLVGPIDFDSFEALRHALAATPGLDTLILDSPGGRVAAARGLARLVNEAGLKTHVTGICASACTLVLLAGSERSMAPGARIGFHGYHIVSDIPLADVRDEQARDFDYLKMRGVSGVFLNRAFETPYEDMWFPTKAELLTSGVLTR